MWRKKRPLSPLTSDTSTTVPGVRLGEEVDEASVCTDAAALADLDAALLDTRELIVHLVGPVGDVLQPLVPGAEEVAPQGRGIVARLNEFDL